MTDPRGGHAEPLLHHGENGNVQHLTDWISPRLSDSNVLRRSDSNAPDDQATDHSLRLYAPLDTHDNDFTSSSRSSRLSRKQVSIALKEVPSHGSLDKEAKPSSWSRIAQNTWTFEVLTLAFSLACMAAIVIVLIIYDGKKLTPLRYGLTLNAIISALATGAETALVAVVASALSQLKWDWFKSRRTLDALQTFDDASRGAFGACWLVIQRTGNIVTVVGAIVTILALVFDPFIQQLIRYPIQTTNTTTGVASTRKASGFDPSIVGLDLLSSINAGIWAEASQFTRAPICTSGNCIWPEFESLGWCSKCEDVTASATFSPACANLTDAKLFRNRTCELKLGSGASTEIAFLTHTPGQALKEEGFTLTLTSEALWQNHGFYGITHGGGGVGKMKIVNVLGVEGPAMGFAYMQMSNFTPWALSVGNAQQCILTPCTRRYSVHVTNGTAETTVISTNYGIVLERKLYAASYDTWDYPNCWQPNRGNISYEFTGAQDRNDETSATFIWANKTASAFCPVDAYTQQIAVPFTGSLVVNYSSLGHGNWGTDENPTVWSSTSTLQRIAGHNLSFITANLAAALTALTLDQSNETVTGTVLESNTYVMVRWKWLIYPIILEIAGVAVFVLTIIQTKSHKTVLWRTSLLSLLFHMSVRHDANDDPVPIDSAGMTKRAERLHARLFDDDGFTALHID